MSTQKLVEKILEQLAAQGATEAEVIYSEGSGVSVTGRASDVETIENNQDKSLVITVYKNHAKGTASTAVVNQDNINLTMEKALAIAGMTEPDEAAGLADPELLAKEFRALETWYDNHKPIDDLMEMVLKAEAAAVDYANQQGRQITIDDASVQMGEGYSVYANSNGFYGEKRGSNVSASVVAIAEHEGQMEREYWWDAKRRIQDLEAVEQIGIKAAQRTLQRAGSRKIKSCKAPVLFDPSCAKTLIGHMTSAISGSSLYQEASFLKNDLHNQLFPEWFSLYEDPFITGGFASRNFDSNGVQTHQRHIIEQGLLNGFLLSVYSARRLGLTTTGNAGGAHNLEVQSQQPLAKDLIKTMDRGLLVTSMMGQGVNPVTGDYSRGASGFWVEHGEIQFPVSELTIAGNLKQMFRDLQAVGDDVDRRSKTATGSWLIGEMTIAGD
ncbi:metalloprotease PmbA [Marinicella sediminis]|uniref:Metalloprotease PmbA n=1 Tax=Marinicella sediminis TaxID=1792834 RepID=A0ABV7JHA9_9GAMM|nr:metalloprotease PmbA [Marinicella sediminis]